MKLTGLPANRDALPTHHRPYLGPDLPRLIPHKHLHTRLLRHRISRMVFPADALAIAVRNEVVVVIVVFFVEEWMRQRVARRDSLRAVWFHELVQQVQCVVYVLRMCVFGW